MSGRGRRWPALPDVAGPGWFAARTGVSRETLDRLERFDALLLKWQARINLIGPGTIPDRWRRHFLDSAQLAALATGDRWIDLGSGAGFPGLVLAAMDVGAVTLYESDLRKAAFLQEAILHLDLRARVERKRIETVTAAGPADVITARALAPLALLLDLAHRFAGPETILLLPKGQDVDSELTEATKYWSMEVDRHPSQSDPKGVILRLQRLRRVAHA
jgi:16S rRNA (guanine527-N7)-methyltransferase